MQIRHPYRYAGPNSPKAVALFPPALSRAFSVPAPQSFELPHPWRLSFDALVVRRTNPGKSPPRPQLISNKNRIRRKRFSFGLFFHFNQHQTLLQTGTSRDMGRNGKPKITRLGGPIFTHSASKPCLRLNHSLSLNHHNTIRLSLKHPANQHKKQRHKQQGQDRG